MTAIAIVLILVAAGIYALTLPKEEPVSDALEVTIIPSSISVLTNESVELNVTVKLVSASGETKIVTDECSLRWSATPWNYVKDSVYAVGDRVFLRAGLAAGVIVVTCKADYDDGTLSDEGSVSIAVRWHTLHSVVIEPGSVTMFLNQTTTIRAKVFSEKGIEIPGAIIMWHREGSNPDAISLNRSSGPSVNVTSVALGNATLVASVRYNASLNESETAISVVTGGPRTVDYRWYDMFNVPFQEWWWSRFRFIPSE